MSLLCVSYIINFFLLSFLGISFFKTYRDFSGAFFLIFCVSTGIWFMLYFLTYSFISDLWLLTSIIQASYFCSLVALYSFLFFLFYFWRKKTNKGLYNLSLFIVTSFVFGMFYILTPYMISGVYFHDLKMDWYEEYWVLFPFHIFLSLLFIPIASYLWYKSLKQTQNIERKRIQIVLSWMLIFVVLSFVFLLLLPYFWILKFEKYIPLFLLPFVFWVFYSIRKYHFLNFKLSFIKGLIFVYSASISYLIVQFLENQILINLSSDFKVFWWVWETRWFFEGILAVILCLFLYKILKGKFTSDFTNTDLALELEKLKNQIPFIVDIDSLNYYLKNNFSRILNNNEAKLIVWIEKCKKNILEYFKGDVTRGIFINDYIFIEAQKFKFKWSIPKENKNDNSYLIYCLRDSHWNIQWFFELWRKILNDPYLDFELQELKLFSDFLQWHLKYLSVYKRIEDLTINLDKQVDEKTIEYNTLLSKQKEYIAYVGHEIKNPITNAIFLSDGLRKDVYEISRKNIAQSIQEDTDILYGELLKVSDLVKTIFSAEKFDLDKVKLYKTDINIWDFISQELSGFKRAFPQVTFDVHISKTWIRSIDLIQFRQVIHNLINNAVKFSWSKNSKVRVEIWSKNDHIYIAIEDNWPGFWDENMSRLFDKYSTGQWSLSWLGMWLYLCQKIIDIHGGKISAWKWVSLSWARFLISL